MSAFEVFARTDWRKSDHPEPWVTITSTGTLSLNTAAVSLLGTPKAVEYLFDAENQVIGLRGVAPTSPNAYKLSPATEARRQHVVNGRAFVRHYQLEAHMSTRRPARLDGNGVLCVDLNHPGVRVTSNRSKS